MEQLALLNDLPQQTQTSDFSELMVVNNHFQYLETEDILEKYLQEELSRFEMLDIAPITEHDVTAKFRFSSAFQKSVRRGYVDDAIRYGLTYLQLDASSFWARLPIIALEDVAMGNPIGVALCLAAARSKILRAKIGGEARVASFIIKTLTESIKDRSVCDMMQIHWHRPLKYKDLTTLKNANMTELSEIALAENTPSSYRTSAAWLLWGSNRHENNNLPLRSGSKDLFHSMIERLHIPPLIKYICLRGMVGCRFPMPLVFPFMWQRMQKSVYYFIQQSCFTTERHYIQEVPQESFDIYTRQGKSSFGYFTKSCPQVDKFLTDKGITSMDAKIRAIGAVIFVTEGSLLDRKLVFEGLQEITEAVEQIDYLNAGMTLEGGRELSRLIQDNHELLRQARQRVVEGRTK